MKQLTRFAGLDMRKLFPRQPIVDALLMKRRKCQRTANASKSTKQMPICFVWQHLNSAFRALHNMRWLHPSFSVVIPLSSIIFGANEFCIAHSSVQKRTGMRCISIEQKLVSFHLDAEIGMRERETGVQFDAMPVWRRVSRHTQHTLCCECQCGMRVQSPLHACAPCRVFFMIFGFGFGVEAKTKQQPLNERSVSHTSCACGAKSAAGRRQKANMIFIASKMLLVAVCACAEMSKRKLRPFVMNFESK